jgi:hypothetical protein
MDGPAGNAVEVIAQVVSALATAGAAVFAALSARSASEASREMQRARELSTAPLLTITPTREPVGYHLDLDNGSGSTGAGDELHIENHGNGPALNISVKFTLELPGTPLHEEVLVAEGMDYIEDADDWRQNRYQRGCACFVSNNEIRWEPDKLGTSVELGTTSETYIVSLGKGEGENLTIPPSLIRRWFVDAVAYNHLGIEIRRHVSHLNISVAFDSMLQRGQRQKFRLELNGGNFPHLGVQHTFNSGGPSYEFLITSAPVRSEQQ